MRKGAKFFAPVRKTVPGTWWGLRSNLQGEGMRLQTCPATVLGSGQGRVGRWRVAKPGSLSRSPVLPTEVERTSWVCLERQAIAAGFTANSRDWYGGGGAILTMC